MSDWLKNDILKTLTETHKRLWEGLHGILPGFQAAESKDPSRDTYLNTLASWEETVKRILNAESSWLAQWTQQLASQQGMPEPISEWMQRVEELMRHWLQTQTDLWDECFRMLKSGGDVSQRPVSHPVARPEIAGKPAAKAAAKLVKVGGAAGEPAGPTRHPPAKDDLKTISGLGPVLEKKLNAYGISSYRQLAELTDDEIKRVETAITKFSGRIHRDNWIEQAKEQHFQKYQERL